jgi:DNA-binding NarL/FixJ family response regulator
VVGEAVDGRQAVHMVENAARREVMMDAHMRSSDGLRYAAHQGWVAGIRVVILTILRQLSC